MRAAEQALIDGGETVASLMERAGTAPPSGSGASPPAARSPCCAGPATTAATAT
jgi:hypothetical protein